MKSLCGSLQTPAGWVEPNRVIYDHELVLFEAGQYQLEVDGVVYDCEPNRYIIIPPGHWHTSTCLEAGVRHYAHFDWQFTNLRPGTPVMTFSPARPKHRRYRTAPEFVPAGVISGSVNSPLVCYELMSRLRLMLASDQSHEHLASRGVLLELLVRLLDWQQHVPVAQHRKETLAFEVRSLLDQVATQQAADIAIRPLLASMGHTYEHLARIFRQQYGLTPIDYVQSIRIERARHLLRHTDDKLTVIAQAVGYRDAIYFSRLFKRYTGKTPGSYRND
ncbi:MAG: helix-turn-helix transcriptional regulator [Phycisphaeraceae bacterium JB051]